MIISKGNGKDLEFGHTDYITGEGRFVSRGQNHSKKERYINPELTPEERKKISDRDNNRRNQYGISLYCENNTRILGFVCYNPATEDLSLTCNFTGNNGKKVFYLNGRRN